MESRIREHRSPFKPIIEPFQEFTHRESAGGILLLAATFIALFWANSPWAESYTALWRTPISVAVGSHTLTESFLDWINDGLMAMFFFVIGLEMKREILVGELRSLRQAAFPLAAAIGGTIVPALLFTAFNINGQGQRGWAIPMATDIAFALGILSLLGKRIPYSLKIFLAALAIGDDLLAVLVIALFYTSTISWLNLGIGAAFLLLLILTNAFGVRHLLVYCVFGIGGLWLAFLVSGVHATIAGVLAAMTIPAQTGLGRREFITRGQRLLRRFEAVTSEDKPELANQEREDVTRRLDAAVKGVDTPLQRLEHALHPWVTVVIMPMFALANAGIPFGADSFSSIANPIALGVMAGLLLGKPAGVLLGSWIAITLGIARMPEGVTWSHMIGVGFLAGIGFTMSLFITGLAFSDEALSLSAKAGILLASGGAGSSGWIILQRIPVKIDAKI